MKPKTYIHRPNTFPHNLLIREIWRVQENRSGTLREKVLPKGTVEIIFNFSGKVNYSKSVGKEFFCLPPYIINGLNFVPVDLHTATNPLCFIGIQLHVFALNYLFRIPSDAFNDQILECSLVCKSLDSLGEKISETPSFEGQVNVIKDWLSSKIKDFDLLDTTRRVMQLNADTDLVNLSVKGIGEKYNITPRHLRRISTEYFGMCTEDLILYKKYLAALHCLHSSNQSLTQTGLECGFYDQSHFTRTFKLFTGLTPSQYRKAKGNLPGHIFEFSG